MDEVEFEIVVEGRTIGVRVIGYEQRVAVRGRTHDGLGGYVAAGTWPVLNEELLTKALRYPLPDQPCRRVSEPSGRKASDDTHRPRRIGLRPRDPRERRQRSNALSQMQKISAGKFHF